MPDAADDLRDREEDIIEDHLLGWCDPETCPICGETDIPGTPGNKQEIV